MEKYCATSDVKCTDVETQSTPCIGLTSGVLPEVQKPDLAQNSHTGVSTSSVPKRSHSADSDNHWYALRTTYGREKKAYDYLVSHNVEAFLPTLKSVKLVSGKRVTIEESRIPNIFFAYGKEDEIKSFVYDNVNLPFLRFYYTKKHISNRIVNVPIVVPEYQMNSLMIICSAESDDIVASTEIIERFKVGQKVRIIDGKFRGVIGTIARYNSQQRVGIIIDGLLTMCTAYIPSAFIEKVNDVDFK